LIVYKFAARNLQRRLSFQLIPVVAPIPANYPAHNQQSIHKKTKPRWPTA